MRLDIEEKEEAYQYFFRSSEILQVGDTGCICRLEEQEPRWPHYNILRRGRRVMLRFYSFFNAESEGS